MKKILLIILVAMTANNLSAQFFPVDTMKLNSAYKDLVNNSNTLECQEAFFDAFPNTWTEFDMTYHFFREKKYDLAMYHIASNHIDALDEKMTLIPDSIYCGKLVNIAIGGSLEADAPNYLRQLLHKKMEQKMDAMFHYIAQLRKGHQMQFWQFYWSTIHPDKGTEAEFARLKRLNKDIHPKEVQMMSDAYKYFYDGVNFASNGYLAID